MPNFHRLLPLRGLEVGALTQQSQFLRVIHGVPLKSFHEKAG